jgi:hypothetical protein
MREFFYNILKLIYAKELRIYNNQLIGTNDFFINIGTLLREQDVKKVNCLL